MAIHPNSPAGVNNVNNNPEEAAERAIIPPRTPNPNNGIMAAPNNNFRPFGGGVSGGAFGRNQHPINPIGVAPNGVAPRQFLAPVGQAAGAGAAGIGAGVPVNPLPLAAHPHPHHHHHHHHNLQRIREPQFIPPPIRNPGVAAIAAPINLGPGGGAVGPLNHGPAPAGLLAEDEDEREQPGPILVKINCPVIIKGDNNVCSVDPAVLTQRITYAIARSLRTMGGGVPMVDGNGAPREIRVEVLAQTTIEGNKNLVGEKYHHLVAQAEEVQAAAVNENGGDEVNENGVADADENGVPENYQIANGAANEGGRDGIIRVAMNGKGKRKASAALLVDDDQADRKIDRKIEHQEPDFLPSGLGIKLEPLDDLDHDQEEDETLAVEHSVKRPRRE